MCDYRTMDEELGWQEIGQRFREARIAHGLTQDELGKRVGRDRTAINKIEGGKRHVDAVELIRLSNALGLPLGHFLSSRSAVVSRRSSVLEDDATDVDRQTFYLDAALEAWLRDVRQLVALTTLRPSPLILYKGPKGSPEDARNAARWLRARLGLGDEPVGLMIEAAERAGVLIAVTEAPGEGASVLESGFAVAVVSAKGDPGRRRTTAAHELGHLVLGDAYSNDIGVNASKRDQEAVIDAFAAEFLLPESATATIPLTRAALIKVAATYRVSWRLAVNQLARVRKLAAEAIRALKGSAPTKTEFSETLGWVPQPDLESIRVPPCFKNAVMDAFRQGEITSRRAAEMTRGEFAESDFPEVELKEPCL